MSVTQSCRSTGGNRYFAAAAAGLIQRSGLVRWVCLSACQYVGTQIAEKYSSKLRRIFSACYPRSWLGTLTFELHCDMRCIHEQLEQVVTFPNIGSLGWLGSRVVSVLDSGAEGPGFKS